MTSKYPQLLNNCCSYCHFTVSDDSASISCLDCNTVTYCTYMHQILGWPDHKKACSSICLARKEVDLEQTKLRQKCWRCLIVEDKQDDHEHFWEWRDVRQVVTTRFNLIHHLKQVPTRRAIQECVDLCHSALKLNPSDRLHLMWLIPGFLIRLGRDHEAFEYVKRYQRISACCQYAWAHLDMGSASQDSEEDVLDVDKDEGRQGLTEVLADGKWAIDDSMPLAFKAALMLMGLKLLFCLRDLENALVLDQFVPPEIVSLIRETLIAKTVHNDPRLWKEVKACDSLRQRIASVEKHLKSQFNSMSIMYPNFWIDLIRPRKHATKPGNAPKSETEIESIVVAHNELRCWDEVTGSLDWVKANITME